MPDIDYKTRSRNGGNAQNQTGAWRATGKATGERYRYIEDKPQDGANGANADGAALTYAPAIAISVAGASKATGLALTKQGKARYEKGSSSFTPRKSSDISQSAKDAKHIDGNSNANRFAQNKGYKDAHDFKNQVLKDANAKDKNVAHYDIYHNAKTGETFLKHKVTGIFIAE